MSKDGQAGHEGTRTGLFRRQWYEARWWGGVLLVAYAALALLPLLVAFLSPPSTYRPFLAGLGRALALAAFPLLCLQPVLNARFRWVEAPFGYDRVTRFHRNMAIAACLMLALHPVVMAIAWRSAWLFTTGTPWHINMGKVTLVLLLAVTVVAAFARRLPVDYQKWRVAHKAAIVIPVLGFVHGWAVGASLRARSLQVYWALLLGAAVLVFLYRNLVAPLRARRCEVASVEQETHDTWTLGLKGGGGRPMAYRPGQFMFLKLLRPDRRSEEHPFTISSSPTESGRLTATVKESGDFTRTIGQTRPGDLARVEGPFGRFSLTFGEAPAFVFIAGGVGITPVMSMLRYLRDTEDTRPAVLLFGNEKERDIVFREELDALPGRIRVVHVLRTPGEDWQGETGLVTRELIAEHSGKLLPDAHVFLCGPPPMMDAVLDELKALGVPRRRVHSERFAL